MDAAKPSIAVVQDKAEWDITDTARDFRDPQTKFMNVECLREDPSIFKVLIRKDAHNRGEFNRQSAEEIGCHAWIVYYHPRIVCRLAPYIRPQHVIRTWHSLEPADVPEFTAEGRRGCLLSGAASVHYPFRRVLLAEAGRLPETTVLPHPGYHRRGCQTPVFLQTLSRFKVAICTSSMYGYALRKLIEATACGCTVLTDLPSDEVLPGGIDGNLVRVTPDFHPSRVANVLKEMLENWDAEKQQHFAELAKDWYDWRGVGSRLAADVESMRSNWND